MLNRLAISKTQSFSMVLKYSEFLVSNNTLQVYKRDRLIFTSSRDGLLPLLEYIGKFAPSEREVTVFDRVVGNAAALLLKKLFCNEIYSPLGSELAAKTLSRFGISYHFTEIVPYIQNRSREDMCPMEKLSMNKSPEEFYEACLSLDLGYSF